MNKRLLPFRATDQLTGKLDEIVKTGGYSSRNEIITLAVEKWIKNYNLRSAKRHDHGAGVAVRSALAKRSRHSSA